MRLSAFHIIFAFLAACFSAASWGAPAPHCQSRYIASFTLEGVSGFPNSGDFCQEDPALLPPPVQETLERIGILHFKYADLLRIDPSLLFRRAPRITLQANPMGPQESSLQGQELLITVFPDWPKVDWGSPIDEAVYVHELTHFLANYGDPLVLPALFTLSRESSILFEGLPDFFAQELTGELIQPARFGLPACLRLREVSGSDSFNQARGMFDSMLVTRKMDACCAGLERDQAHTSKSLSLCSQFQKQMSEFGESLPPFNEAPFQASDLRDSFLQPVGGETLEPHQLSLPVLSFWSQLSVGISEPIGSRVIQALKKASEDERSHPRFNCTMSGDEQGELVFQVQGSTYRPFFEKFREGLTEEQKRTHDLLWEKHGMAQALALDEIDLTLHVQEQARTLMLKAMFQNSSETLSEQNSCYGELANQAVEGNTSCRIVCERMKDMGAVDATAPDPALSAEIPSDTNQGS